MKRAVLVGVALAVVAACSTDPVFAQRRGDVIEPAQAPSFGAACDVRRVSIDFDRTKDIDWFCDLGTGNGPIGTWNTRDLGRPWYDVRHPRFNAKGDGISIDTTPFRKAMKAAADAGGDMRIPRSAGPYLVTRVAVRKGVRRIVIEGGAEIQQPPTAVNFDRVFEWTLRICDEGGEICTSDGDCASGDTCVDNFTGSSEDYPSVTIEGGGTIDGNRANRGTYTGYEQEQSHAIFVMADPLFDGKAVAIIDGITVKDTTGDAFSFYTNVDAQVSNIRAVNAFRGGLTVSGGCTNLQINGFRGTGDEYVSGFNIEPSAQGSCGWDTNVVGGAIEIDGAFDIGVQGDSRVVLSDVISHGLIRNETNAPGPFAVQALDDAYIRVSSFDIRLGHNNPGGGNKIVRPNHVEFTDGVFRLQEPFDDSDDQYEAIYVQWFSGSQPQDQYLLLDNVGFVVDSAATSTDTKIAIQSLNATSSLGAVIECVDCRISSDFDYGLFGNSGGEFRFSGGRCEADTCFYFDDLTSETSMLSVQGGAYEPGSYYLGWEGTRAHDFTHRGVALSAVSNRINATAEQIDALGSTLGSRTVEFSSAPTIADVCLSGDVGIAGDDRYECDENRVWQLRAADWVSLASTDQELTAPRVVGADALQVGRGEVLSPNGTLYVRLSVPSSGVNPINYINASGPQDFDINFTSGTHVPSGWDGYDAGAAYPKTEGTELWGWDVAIAGNCRERDPGTPDSESGLCFVQTQQRTWRAAGLVPGHYTITGSIGDATGTTADCTIDVSGDGVTWVSLFADESTASGEHKTATVTPADSCARLDLNSSGEAFIDQDCDGIQDLTETQVSSVVISATEPICGPDRDGAVWADTSTGTTALSVCLKGSTGREWRRFMVASTTGRVDILGAQLSALGGTLTIGDGTQGLVQITADTPGGGCSLEYNDSQGLWNFPCEVKMQSFTSAGAGQATWHGTLDLTQLTDCTLVTSDTGRVSCATRDDHAAYLNQIADSGSGSSGSPWIISSTGWDTVKGGVVRVPPGTYEIAHCAGLEITDGTRIQCEAGAVLSLPATTRTCASAMFASADNADFEVSGCTFDPGITVETTTSCATPQGTCSGGTRDGLACDIGGDDPTCGAGVKNEACLDCPSGTCSTAGRDTHDGTMWLKIGSSSPGASASVQILDNHFGDGRRTDNQDMASGSAWRTTHIDIASGLHDSVIRGNYFGMAYNGIIAVVADSTSPPVYRDFTLAENHFDMGEYNNVPCEKAGKVLGWNQGTGTDGTYEEFVVRDNEISNADFAFVMQEMYGTNLTFADNSLRGEFSDQFAFIKGGTSPHRTMSIAGNYCDDEAATFLAQGCEFRIQNAEGVTVSDNNVTGYSAEGFIYFEDVSGAVVSGNYHDGRKTSTAGNSVECVRLLDSDHVVITGNVCVNQPVLVGFGHPTVAASVSDVQITDNIHAPNSGATSGMEMISSLGGVLTTSGISAFNNITAGTADQADASWTNDLSMFAGYGGNHAKRDRSDTPTDYTAAEARVEATAYGSVQNNTRYPTSLDGLDQTLTLPETLSEIFPDGQSGSWDNPTECLSFEDYEEDTTDCRANTTGTTVLTHDFTWSDTTVDNWQAKVVWQFRHKAVDSGTPIEFRVLYCTGASCTPTTELFWVEAWIDNGNDDDHPVETAILDLPDSLDPSDLTLRIEHTHNSSSGPARGRTYVHGISLINSFEHVSYPGGHVGAVNTLRGLDDTRAMQLVGCGSDTWNDDGDGCCGRQGLACAATFVPGSVAGNCTDTQSSDFISFCY